MRTRAPLKPATGMTFRLVINMLAAQLVIPRWHSLPAGFGLPLLSSRRFRHEHAQHQRDQ